MQNAAHSYKACRLFSSQAKKRYESEAFVDSSEILFFYRNHHSKQSNYTGQVMLVAQTPPLTTEPTAGDRPLL